MKYPIVDTLIQEARRRECDLLERTLLEMNALPVRWAWEGCFGVRADGEVVYVNDNGEPEPIVCAKDEPSMSVATLVYAAQRNSDLACLLPAKPVEAQSCRTCSGTGHFKSYRSALCGDCEGLGWRRHVRDAA